jgi:hypothetical protein
VILLLQVVLVNSSILYYNPSDTDSCREYTQKRIFAYRQVSLLQRLPGQRTITSALLCRIWLHETPVMSCASPADTRAVYSLCCHCD